MRKSFLQRKMLLAFVLMLFGTLALQAGTYGGGTGTEGDPFLISSKADLLELDTTTLDWGANLFFKVTSDIDMAGETFYPIGYGTKVFSATFDGDNKMISNLTIMPWEGQGNNDGFGFIGGMTGTVKNLILNNLNFDYAGNRAAGFVGVLTSGEISNCALLGGSIKGGGWTGSFVGVSWGTPTVTNCFSNAKVSAGWGHSGIYGDAKDEAIISNCAFYGTINGGNAISGGSAVITDCVYISSCGGSGEGVALSPEEATLQTNYANFDFENVWVMKDKAYAVLQTFDNSIFDAVVIPTAANAGEDKEVYVGSEVTLNGSGSTVYAGGSLTYAWTAPAEITLDDASAAMPTFSTPMTEGSVSYTFSLVVNDGEVSSGADEVVITVINPEVSGNLFKNGTFYMDTAYWNFAEGAAVIDTGDIATSMMYYNDGTNGFNGPLNADSAYFSLVVGKTYDFSFDVYVEDWAATTLINFRLQDGVWRDDAKFGMTSDVMTWGSKTPAGQWLSYSQRITIPETWGAAGEEKTGCYLHLGGSSEEGNPVVYFDNMTLVEYVIPTVAMAGDDQQVDMGSEVTLDGSASTVYQGGSLTYMWTAPEGITLDDASAVMPKFTAPDVAQKEKYVFSLVVNDGAADSEADEVVITVVNPDFKDPFDKAGWTFVSATSVKEGQEPSLAFDGDVSTQVFSDWTDASVVYPMEFVVDLGIEGTLGGITYQGRNDEWGPNGTIEDYEVYMTNDMNDWGTAVASGTFTYPTPASSEDKSYYKVEQNAIFSAPVAGRYLKLVALSCLGEGSPQLGIAELTAMRPKMAPIYKPAADTLAISRDGVRIEDNANKNLGYTAAGSWAEYSVDLPEDGYYYVSYESASPNDAGSIQLLVNGADKGTTPVPNTGNWQVYNDVVSGAFMVEAGTTTIRIVTPNGSLNFKGFTVNKYYPVISVDAQATATMKQLQTAQLSWDVMKHAYAEEIAVSFESLDASIASVDEAGLVKGELVGLTKVVVIASDGVASVTDTVDIMVTSSKIEPIVLTPADTVAISRNGFKVEDAGNFGFTLDGSWAKFNVDFPEDGYYIVQYHASSDRENGQIITKIAGLAVDTTLVPKNGWAKYNDVPTDTFMVSAGDDVEFMIEAIAPNTYAWNMDRLAIYRYYPLTSIGLPSSVTIDKGDSLQLEWSQESKLSDILSSSFTSLDETVVTVSAEGLLKPVNGGMAKVAWSFSDGINVLKDTIMVSVNQAVEGVSVTPESIVLERGETGMVTAMVMPADALNKNVVWRSNNTRVVTVDGDGNLVSLSPGTTIVYAITEDGFFKDTCEVTVTPILVKAIEVKPKEVTLQVGGADTKKLTFSFTPSNAADRTYTVESLDESVVTVSSTGLLLAVARGKADVVVTSNDGDFTDTCKVTVLGGVAIENAEASKLSLYPNPVNGNKIMLSIPGNVGSASVAIYSIQGRLLSKTQIEGELSTVYLDSEITKGVYFVRIDASNGSYLEKLTVQ